MGRTGPFLVAVVVLALVERTPGPSCSERGRREQKSVGKSPSQRPRASLIMPPSNLCPCNDPGKDAAPMILCDNCNIWCAVLTPALLALDALLLLRYHFECIRLSESDADDIGQRSPRCSERRSHDCSQLHLRGLPAVVRPQVRM